ncbi:MAG: [Lachnospiraceae bacterium]|nr:[FeFe] hydrogenase H-cluster maturation GTPase HydF [Lachnospiraceae bacterium]
MSLTDTPLGERIHIAFFGCRNAGKSSLVNAFTNQPVSIVSEVAGTTTDPVTKSMELLPIGPVAIIDTPGIDDTGALGEMRVIRTQKVLQKTDLAVLVVAADTGMQDADRQFLEVLRERDIPTLVVHSKADLLLEHGADREGLYVSAKDGYQMDLLREKVASLRDPERESATLTGDLVSAGDKVLLVVPIDQAAPKGRLILPQQQVIRDLLDHGAIPVICRDTELEETLSAGGFSPKLVITDSQAFQKVHELLPAETPLTSFSILMARYKGILTSAVQGAGVIGGLSAGDKVLISEGCTHRRQCGDIGTVKLPALLRKKTGQELTFAFSSGTDFPEDLTTFRLIIHCGGCMLNEAEMKARERAAAKAGMPMTNYGIAIAWCNGILERSIAMLPEFGAEE